MPTTKTKTPPAAGELLDVDPNTLLIGTNVRTDADLDDAFVESVRDYGVLEAITAYRDGDGRLVVARGQRRTLAAVRAGRPTVPVRVVPESDAIERVVHQHTENHHRLGMSAADDAATAEQLAAFGLTAEEIAGKLHRSDTDVRRALSVARSRAASAVAAHHDLALDDLAGIAEFEDDPAVVERLTAAADKGEPLAHLLQRARNDREEQHERDRIAAELHVAGVTVLDDRPAYGGPEVTLEELGLTPDGHAACPGHAADIARGGYRVDGVWANGVHARYWCTNAKANGHRKPRGNGQAAPAERTEEEQRAASEELRRVKEGNRAWRAATTVRRTWIRTQLLPRKAAPAGAERFIITTLLAGPHELKQALEYGDNHRQFRDAMGLDADPPAGSVDRMMSTARDIATLQELAGRAAPKRATLLAAVLLLSAWEGRTGDHTWRRGDPTAARCLRALESWGYPLAPIERGILDAADAAEQETRDRQEQLAADLAAGDGQE